MHSSNQHVLKLILYHLASAFLLAKFKRLSTKCNRGFSKALVSGFRASKQCYAASHLNNVCY